MDEEQSGSTGTSITDNLDIPGYLTYVVLVYRLASAVFVIGMGSLIISTIVKTRALHNVHNILIVNLMVADIVIITAYTFQTTGMIFSYIIGIDDPFSCNVLYFFQFLIINMIYTFVMLSLDKFVAIKFPLRYNTIVTHRRAYLAIIVGWIIALLFRITRLVYELTAGIEYHKSSQLGSCSIKQQPILIALFTMIIPIFLSHFITVTLDIYLSIKAYQVYRKIQQENREAKVNKTQQLKPVITLLVTVIGSMAILVINSIVHITATLMVENKAYQLFIKHMLVINLGYLSVTLHPLVYGLYFSEIRQPLCRKLKSMVLGCKKVNSISPSQGRSIQRTWI